MKITFEVPEWSNKKIISIFAGTELLAQRQIKVIFDQKEKKHKNIILPIKIKPENGRCNGCGDCCSNSGSPFYPYLLEDVKKRLNNYIYSKKGKCPLLTDDGCILKNKIPFACISSNCEGKTENCTERLL